MRTSLIYWTKTTASVGLAALCINASLLPRSYGQSGPSPSPPRPELSPAERIWTVTLNRTPKNSLFCEAVARGRNAAAGGYYEMHYRRETGTAPQLVVTYTKPSLRDISNMVVVLDDKTLMKLSVRNTKLGRDDAIVANLDTASFNPMVLAEMEKPSATALELRVGARVFQAPVSGFAVVTEAMNKCTEQMTPSK